MNKNGLGVVKKVHDLIHLSEAEYESLLDRITVSQILKNDCLLKLGQTCKKLSFLENGTVSHIRYSSSGDRHIVNLSLQGDWVLDHESFTRQSPSNIAIIAQSNCLVSSISIESLHELIAISNKYFILGRLFAASELESFMNRHDTTPDVRYLYLLEHRPELLQAFTLKDIASFLRMTPETLSRIRKRIRKA